MMARRIPLDIPTARICWKRCMLSCIPIIAAAWVGPQPSGPSAKPTPPRAALKVAAKPNDDKYGMRLEFTLTNTSKELWASSWMEDAFEGLSLEAWNAAGDQLRPRSFYNNSYSFKAKPDFIVLRPGESRLEPIAVCSFFEGKKLPDGKYKFKAIYTNKFFDEVYKSDELELTLPK